MRRLAKKSFTMAEILLSLTIIGVVAAITLPSLTGNINERTWATQKKALFARMSQAVALVSSMNDSDNAESFVTSQLSKVLKINNVCSNTNLVDCGINSDMLLNASGQQFTNPAGDGKFPKTWRELGVTSISFNYTSNTEDATSVANDQNAQVAAFETQNGESIVLFYNPGCTSDMEYTASEFTGTGKDMLTNICINMIYDLNSAKGPNTVGKDIGFMTVYYPSDSVVVHPIPATATSSITSCADEYRGPNLEEALSMSLNQNLIGGAAMDYPSTKVSEGHTFKAVKIDSSGKAIKVVSTEGSSPSGTTRCVKR